jgi:hypothetical protein
MGLAVLRELAAPSINGHLRLGIKSHNIKPSCHEKRGNYCLDAMISIGYSDKRYTINKEETIALMLCRAA